MSRSGRSSPSSQFRCREETLGTRDKSPPTEEMTAQARRLLRHTRRNRYGVGPDIASVYGVTSEITGIAPETTHLQARHGDLAHFDEHCESHGGYGHGEFKTAPSSPLMCIRWLSAGPKHFGRIQIHWMLSGSVSLFAIEMNAASASS